MARSRVEFDITTGKVTVGPGELEQFPFDSIENRANAIKSIEFIGSVKAHQDCSELFLFMRNLKEIKGLGNLDVSETISMVHMFYGCSKLESVDLSSWNTAQVTTVDSMFGNCAKLERFNAPELVHEGVKSTHAMFENCGALKEIDVSKWRMDNVKSVNFMFHGCANLEQINGIEAWNLPVDCTFTFAFDDCPAKNEAIQAIDGAVLRSDDRAERARIDSFKGVTETLFKPIETEDRTLTAKDYERGAITALKDLANWNDLDIEIIDAAVTGSRSRGIEHEGSDVDVVIEYRGDYKEDFVFSELKEVLAPDNFAAEVKLDVNPIRAEESGTLGQYLARTEEYLQEKMNAQMKVRDRAAAKAQGQASIDAAARAAKTTQDRAAAMPQQSKPAR